MGRLHLAAVNHATTCSTSCCATPIHCLVNMSCNTGPPSLPWRQPHLYCHLRAMAMTPVLIPLSSHAGRMSRSGWLLWLLGNTVWAFFSLYAICLRLPEQEFGNWPIVMAQMTLAASGNEVSFRYLYMSSRIGGVLAHGSTCYVLLFRIFVAIMTWRW